MNRRHLAASAALLLAGCSIPPRDNPVDPANVPDPPGADIDVFVDGLESTVGQRNSKWILDGSNSDAPEDSCYEWSLSTEFVDAPAEIEEWLGIDTTPCNPVVVATTANTLGTALAAIADFEIGPGTAISRRWVRLVVESPAGGEATFFKAITIVNTVPSVSLGPDRRTAPGGRWWLSGEEKRFVNVLTAAIDDGDPDPIVDVRWRVTGELATRLDLANEFFPSSPATTDGYVDTIFYETASPRLELPMSIDPALSEITVEVRDFIGPQGAAASPAGIAEVRVDVLTTLWAYSMSTGHLRRLDTTQFLSGFTDFTQEPIAYAGGTILWAKANGSQIDVNRSGLGMQARSSSLNAELVLDEDFTANFGFRLAAAPASGGGWWLQDGERGRLYKISADLTTAVKLEDIFTGNVGPLDLQRDFYAGNGGGYAGIADAGNGRVWVLGGERAGTATAGQRVLLVKPDAAPGIGNALVVAPVDPFPGETTEGALIAPDGTGGAWIASSLDDRKLSHVTINAMNQTTVTVTTLPDACLKANQFILSMVSDPSRNALWLGVTAPEPNVNDPDTDALCRIDTTNPSSLAFLPAPQKVEIGSVIALRPTDGSVYLPANTGEGMNRYRAGDAASLEYIPLQSGAPGLLGLSVQDARFVDDHLLATVSEQFPSFYDKRAILVENAQLFQPNDIDLHIDPYVMEFERHVMDPVTGFVFVWLPDDGVIAVYAPDGTRLTDIEVGYSERRAHLAWDPDGRRIWISFSGLWGGDPFPGEPGVIGDVDGRLLRAVVPEDFPPHVLAEEVDGVYIAMSRGIAVVPGSAAVAPGRVCLAADFEEEPIPDARVRTREQDGTDTGESPFLLASGQDIETWISPDPTTGECWAGRRGVGTEFVRMLPNGSATAVSAASDVRHATVVAPGLAFGITRVDFDEVIFFDTDSADVSLDTPVFEPGLDFTLSQLRGGAFDAYYGHAWMAFDDLEGNVIRMTIGPAPHEAWREQGIALPRIDSGR